MKEKKERYWTFIMYRESMPKDWKKILEEEMIQIAISPEHDMDMQEDGTLKKAHYHVLLMFNGPTTYNRAYEIANKVNGTIPKRVLNVKGMYDYFTHKWNEDKTKYNEEEIISINGFNIEDYGYTNNEIEAMKRQIIDIIRQGEYTEYSTLYDKLYDSQYYNLCEILSKNVLFFSQYLKSKKFIYLNNNISYNVNR